jgi:hypothetical protein
VPSKSTPSNRLSAVKAVMKPEQTRLSETHPTKPFEPRQTLQAPPNPSNPTKPFGPHQTLRAPPNPSGSTEPFELHQTLPAPPNPSSPSKPFELLQTLRAPPNPSSLHQASRGLSGLQLMRSAPTGFPAAMTRLLGGHIESGHCAVKYVVD